MQTRAAFANNTKLALAIGLAASLAASLVIYAYSAQQTNLLSAEVADKSKALEEQRQQIDEKTVQLELLNLQIKSLESEIAAKTEEAQDLSQTIDAQRSEIQLLKAQAASLQDEIQDNENEIALLTGQMQETQSQIESFKRIKVSHYSVAVDQFGGGIVLPIEVEIIPSGEGIISIDVKNVKYETGFQDSVRTAVLVASEYSDVSVSDKDIVIKVINEDDELITIDGGSAGALVTGMIAAGLMDRAINPSVLITGTIESDGTVGNIGSVNKKADAAADFGAEAILVPEDQEFNHRSINVIGVSDIDDVMRYLTS